MSAAKIKVGGGKSTFTIHVDTTVYPKRKAPLLVRARWALSIMRRLLAGEAIAKNAANDAVTWLEEAVDGLEEIVYADNVSTALGAMVQPRRRRRKGGPSSERQR